MEDAAPPRARLLHQSLPCAGLGAHRDGRLRLPSLPGCSYPLHSARARWPSGGARRTPAGFPGLDNLGGTSGERDARVGVCVCVCVCLSVSQWIAERQSQRTAAPARGRILRPEPRGGRCWDSPARTWVPPPLRNHPLRLLPATLSRAPSLPLHLISLRSVLV